MPSEIALNAVSYDIRYGMHLKLYWQRAGMLVPNVAMITGSEAAIPD
jgi:hypothetical protein